ncbi:hypothetical protein [Heyndrickxia coagulans]|uniref:hypothetical protein n=1 Tax=Heyndrickxia coagulans TaxID=1398 RepID=UPI002164CCAB|nr:hypothetical protein [Heyndrickxia coagulans]MDT9755068.1 hypothetical protein [Heyndrickxia coagulans]
MKEGRSARFCREEAGRRNVSAGFGHILPQASREKKVPKKFVFLDDLPRNGVGKILKTQLRKQAADLQP